MPAKKDLERITELKTDTPKEPATAPQQQQPEPVFNPSDFATMADQIGEGMTEYLASAIAHKVSQGLQSGELFNRVGKKISQSFDHAASGLNARALSYSIQTDSNDFLLLPSNGSEGHQSN